MPSYDNVRVSHPVPQQVLLNALSFVPEGRTGVRSDQSLEKEVREAPG